MVPPSSVRREHTWQRSLPAGESTTKKKKKKDWREWITFTEKGWSQSGVCHRRQIGKKRNETNNSFSRQGEPEGGNLTQLPHRRGRWEKRRKGTPRCLQQYRQTGTSERRSYGKRGGEAKWSLPGDWTRSKGANLAKGERKRHGPNLSLGQHGRGGTPVGRLKVARRKGKRTKTTSTADRATKKKELSEARGERRIYTPSNINMNITKKKKGPLRPGGNGKEGVFKKEPTPLT